MHPELWLPVVQVTLPIVFTIAVAAWLNNKRIDDVYRHFDDVNRRIDDFRAELAPVVGDLRDIAKDHERRIRPALAVQR